MEGEACAMPQVQTRERRFNRGLELRELDKAQNGSIATLTGYAAVFDSLSEDLYGFRECIRKGAFAESLKRGDDVRAFYGHDTLSIIGRRSAKTLTIEEDDKGLKMSIDVPDTTVGRDLVVSVKRGDLTGMSFGFETVLDDWRRVDKDGDRVYRRELIQVNLFEVSVVAFPAYADTSVEARDMRSLKDVLDAGRSRMGKDAHPRRDSVIKRFQTAIGLWT